MATPNEKLAGSLKILHDLQNIKGFVAIKTSEINRTHRERLCRNGFLKEVAKGWYVASNPNEQESDSASWYTSFWQFCSRYLEENYGEDYCISADQSILLHAGNNSVPRQLIIRIPKDRHSLIPLPHNTSLLVIKSSIPNIADTMIMKGVRVMTPPSALVYCSPIMFVKNQVDIRTVLSQIKDSSEILRRLLDGSHTIVAGRLAGAFRNIGNNDIADEIVSTMKIADSKINETDPFEDKPTVKILLKEQSPYVNRIKLMWYEMRDVVMNYFPEGKGIPKDHKKYLKSVEEIYVTDAYHSLSIEKYVVSAELIERVGKGKWNIDGNEDDRKQRDAMAARGYWLSSNVVKESIIKILNGDNSGKVVKKDHGIWYRELFAPCVTSGLLKTTDLAGYRINQVYISQSMHVPLNKDAVLDAMPILFELLETEENPGVRAVLGHFIFVYIHPYMDGNGRMARFLMNVMLASGGYPWTVIPVEERKTYMGSLEKASADGDIKPFAKFLSYLVRESLKGKPVAKLKGI
jgi:hypothetical protein